MEWRRDVTSEDEETHLYHFIVFILFASVAVYQMWRIKGYASSLLEEQWKVKPESKEWLNADGSGSVI